MYHSILAALTIQKMEGFFQQLPQDEQCSTVLRQVVLDILNSHQRPLAISELETIIRDLDPDLYKTIKSKCSDYLRVIMSYSERFGIIKYKSLVKRKGIDRRSIFYGRYDKVYPSCVWQPYATSKVPAFRRASILKPTSDKINVKKKIEFPLIPFELARLPPPHPDIAELFELTQSLKAVN